MTPTQMTFSRKMLVIATVLIFIALITPAYFSYSTPDTPITGAHFLSIRFQEALRTIRDIGIVGRYSISTIPQYILYFISYIHFVAVIFPAISANFLVFLNVRDYAIGREKTILLLLSPLSVISVIIHVIQTPNGIGLGSVLLIIGIFLSVWGWLKFTNPSYPGWK